MPRKGGSDPRHCSHVPRDGFPVWQPGLPNLDFPPSSSQEMEESAQARTKQEVDMAQVSPGMVEFPTSDTKVAGAHVVDNYLHPPQYLPFRRISLPTSPSVLHRQSVVSMASFDSFREEDPSASNTPPSQIKGVAKGPKHRPSFVDVNRRHTRKREVRILDEQRETKRRKVIDEFYDTERSYVEGLELIYSHFLTPIIASLDTPHPLLDRTELTSIFSNFIDIWNLHRSFYSSLTSYLHTSTSKTLVDRSPPLSPILLSHFPYLSLYTPFVTSFHDMLSTYTALLSKNHAFASFIAKQEADPRCGKLKLRDWLLTIVQRCPRYLLLLKDFIGYTDDSDPEYAALSNVYGLVLKITDSLNSSLYTHAQTLSLLAIQRNTANMPFQLISPGRTFIKRAPLLQLEGSTPKEREFLLFSDCILWLASTDKGDDVDIAAKWNLPCSDTPTHPCIKRTRSESDPDTPRCLGHSSECSGELKKKDSGLKLKLGGSPHKHKHHHHRKSGHKHASSGADERWVYKGHVDLVDLEVVVAQAREPGEERRFELLSPQISFAVYASSVEERDEWSTGIRNAKASLLVSLNATHPNSTLTSSASTQHLRQTLQAVPYAPEEQESKPKRGKVEHFVPAIWIPDGKTDSCMRCGRTFGWRRRRHHCRLCGRCVCHGCSGKTFFVMDSSAKNSSKSARACDACYDTVFPLIDLELSQPSTMATISHLTLSGLRSMPSLNLSYGNERPASALMAIGLDSPKRPFSRIGEPSPTRGSPSRRHTELSEDGPVAPAIRVKPPARPRSYIQILEDFHDHSLVDDNSPAVDSPATSGFSFTHSRLDDPSFVLDEREETRSDIAIDLSDSPQQERASVSVPPSPRKKEDTVRRHKRFSLPAVAIHTTPVTARPNLVGEGKSKRFSLMLGKAASGGHAAAEFGSALMHGVAAGRLSELLRRDNHRDS